MEVVSSNPSQATSFLFFSTKMITFVLCNIFELIWYSEFILVNEIRKCFPQFLFVFLQAKTPSPSTVKEVRNKNSCLTMDESNQDIRGSTPGDIQTCSVSHFRNFFLLGRHSIVIQILFSMRKSTVLFFCERKTNHL